MIRVNFSDGSTIAFNLDKEDDAKQWLEWSSVKDFQRRITGIGIQCKTSGYHAIPIPKNFESVRFYAELVFNKKNGTRRKLGERIIVHADSIKIEKLVYTYDDPPPPIQSRTLVSLVGKQMFPDHRYAPIEANQ